MKITFFNVGYGEAIWVECPDPKHPGAAFNLLIDGGSAMEQEYEDRSTGRLPLIEHLERAGVDHVDGIILTHIHEDHVCGMLPVVRRFPPKCLWQIFPPDFHSSLPPLPDILPENPDRAKFAASLRDWKALVTLVEEQGGEIHTARADDKLTACPDLDIQVLSPNALRADAVAERIKDLFYTQEPQAFLEKLAVLDQGMNNFSLVLRLDWAGHRILLPGDTNKAGYQGIPQDALRADVFKIGHHGQADGADEELLRVVAPQIVVCCASSDRRHGSANPELMAMVHNFGAKLCCSDCPSLPDGLPPVPPHRALVLEFSRETAIKSHYLGMEGEVLDEEL